MAPDITLDILRKVFEKYTDEQLAALRNLILLHDLGTPPATPNPPTSGEG